MLSPTPSIDRSSLHPGTGYFIGPRVPRGLAAVVEGLTREVLRHHPEDIYVFAAHHFENLLKLREQYHAEEYGGHEFNDEFNREFNLWPTKESKDSKEFSVNGWSLEKEIEILEKRRERRVDMEENPENIPTDEEKQKCTKVTSNTKRISKRSIKDTETISDARATRIISQMSALHNNGKNILTKDIKQELRKNKLSSEKGKIDNVEKEFRGERRSKTKVYKTNKDTEEEETTTTTTSGRNSTRRPLRKVRRIETESETETENETVAKTRFENGYEKKSVKNDNAKREAAIIRDGSRGRRSETAAWLSAHSSERKVSSRALSMDRIRAYVLRKFASTASLEVLRSPTYVEQVQEVIDRAAPIIKEKLEEISRPRGKRSRSVDLGWNEESFCQHVRNEIRYDHDYEKGKEKESMWKKKIERRRNSNGIEQETDTIERKEMEGSPEMENQLTGNGTIQSMEKEERRRRSSGKKLRRREGSEHANSEAIDQIDDSRHSNKLEHESSAARDTLETRLTATQNILEGISMTSELDPVHRIDSMDGEHELSELGISDQVNIVSLPIVRPSSSKNSRNAAKNGSDSLTLPPISPEAPKSTKKRDELSLPILQATGNGNHSARKSQEQDNSKDAEEASTMYDVTSDIEDIAVLPEDEHQNVIMDTEQGLNKDNQKLMPDIRSSNEEKSEGDNYEDEDIILRKNVSLGSDEKRASDVSLDGSFEEFDRLTRPEEGKIDEVFVDSLNVTPEVTDAPMRPDSLEPDEDEQKKLAQKIPVQSNMFDGLKDRLIEIEMAERSIEKALAGQHVATHDGEMTSEAEKSTTDGKINEARKSINEIEEFKSEIEESTNERKILNKEEKSIDEVKESANEMKDSISTAERSINEMEETKNEIEKLTNEIENSNTIGLEKIKNGTEMLVNETDNLTNTIEESTNDIEKINEELINEVEGLKDKIETLKNGMNEEGMTMNQAKMLEQMPIEERKSNKTGEFINKEEELSDVVEDLMIKRHIDYLESTNSRPQSTNDKIIGTDVFEMDGENDVTISKNKVETTDRLLMTTVSGNVAIENKNGKVNFLDENGSETKARRRRKIEESLATPLSLKIPFSYILSEGSPCEIPDSVTTVIIPDRPCPSPVTPDIEESQLESTIPLTGQEEPLIGCDVVVSPKHQTPEDEDRCGYEAFGEYIRPENTILPADIDFMRGVKNAKPCQDIVIVHQDLDRIKEEREEEEEGKESDEKEEKDNAEMVTPDYEMAKLEDIAEHEEDEEIEAKTNIEFKFTSEISSLHIPEQESLSGTAELIADADLMDGGKANAAIESRSMPENTSEESGSSQDVCTTISSDLRENTTSNRSIESPSASRPIVPELNLDSLQDNTVSSFKMTATKESNGSPRESDATTSLIEPLTPDERLIVGNRLAMTDREEQAPIEEVTENLPCSLQLDISEADQLYRAEHAEYEWLEKNPSSESDPEDQIKLQEDTIDAKPLSEDSMRASSILQQKKKMGELGSEEEIARELISSLDNDAQFQGEELNMKKKSENNRGFTENNLNADDRSNQPLSESVHSISVDEPETSKKHEILNNEKITRTETISEISMADISQENENRDSAIIGKETKEPKLDIIEKKHIEIRQAAPLAQFDQDELLEKNGRYKIIDKKITIESMPDINNMHSIDNQGKLEEQMNIEKVSKNQNIENMNKIEKFDNEEKEGEPDKSLDRQKCDQEQLEILKEEHEEFKTQTENGEGNLKTQEEVNEKVMTLEVTTSRKGSMKESIEDEDNFIKNKEIDSTKLIIQDKIDNQMKKEDKKEERIKDLSEVESAHGLIISAISEQSTENHHHGRYWTAGTKSSTLETVIAAFGSDADEKIENLGDTPEITEDEPITQKKDDFYLAVIKLQACIRGFLARRHMQKNPCSEPISNNVLSVQKTAMAQSNRLMVPEDRSNLREATGRTGRQRLRREEALRKTTLSLENAFATGRLQHTGEFHDVVPLLPFATTDNETNSNESLSKESEEDIKQGKHDVTRPNTNEHNHSHPALDDEHQGSFQKDTTCFVEHSTFPIMMHLLADVTRNFAINSDPSFNLKSGETKPMEPGMDILMLNYPRDDATLQNRYLNFITSVEDMDPSMDSLPLNNATESSKNIYDAHPSIASVEGSIMEPLALSNTPQGIVIEELTSLGDIAEDISSMRSESTKPLVAPKSTLNTNNSMPLEECDSEDKRNDLETSSRTGSTNKGDVIGNRKNTDEKTEKQSEDKSVEATDSESVANSRKETEKSNGISRDIKEHVDEGNKENM